MSIATSLRMRRRPPFNLPVSQTGAKIVYLGKPTIETLRRLSPLSGNPWVIYGIKPGAASSICGGGAPAAGLKDARIHDLRHTFASAAAAAGQGLPMIGKLLGHTQVATTARYVHLAAHPVKAAAEHVSAEIAKAVL